MKTTPSSAVAALLILLMTMPAVPMQKAAPLPKNDSCLDQSYTLSQALDGNERLFYLSELTRVSTMIDPPPAQAQEWCLTLFRIASAQQEQRNRTAGQKNALARLVFFNPTLAMELLPQVDAWRPDPGQMLYEDLRSNAAEVIFVKYLKFNPQGISKVTEQARFLGESGQYPYRAMAAVIRLSKFPTEETNNIVSDALSFYARETGFVNRDEEFLVLLQALKGSAVDKDLASQVVSTFVQRLTKEPIQTFATYYGEVQPAGGPPISFADRNSAFLFEAFPVIQRYNAPLAASLLRQDPTLSKATENMQYISGGFVMGNPTSEETTRRHIENIQESLMQRIKEARDSDPESALALAQRLTDTTSRIVGFSSVVPGIVQKNLPEARSVYYKEVSELNNVSNPSDELRAGLALSQAAQSIGDPQRYETLSAKAFKTGVVLFGKDTSKDRAFNHNGFEQLKELVTFTAAQPADNLKAEVLQLPNDWLKAYLLLYEAEGHAKSAQLKRAPAD